jgi:hypothetical protein
VAAVDTDATFIMSERPLTQVGGDDPQPFSGKLSNENVEEEKLTEVHPLTQEIYEIYEQFGGFTEVEDNLGDKELPHRLICRELDPEPQASLSLRKRNVIH